MFRDFLVREGEARGHAAVSWGALLGSWRQASGLEVAVGVEGEFAVVLAAVAFDVVEPVDKPPAGDGGTPTGARQRAV
jgi:hypothetical protein